MSDNNVFWQKYNDPFKLSAMSMILALVLILIGKASGGGFSLENDGKLPWVLASSCILLYSVFNAVGMLATKTPNWYWPRSVYGYIGLVAVIIALSWLITGLSLKETGDFKSILVVLSIVYIVLMTISNTVRVLLKYAKKQDQKRNEKFKNRS